MKTSQMWARVVICVALSSFLENIAIAQIPTKMLRWIPADANAVTVIEVDAMFRTPLSMKESWRPHAADRFANQEINVPPEARRAVMVSQLDLGGTLQPAWELGIVELEKTPSFALLARTNGGQLDTISGHSAVRMSGRTVIELEPGVVMGTREPNRQVVSRWVGSTKNDSSPRLSGFLKDAIEKADRKAHIICALDLNDSITAPPIRELLEDLEPLKGKTADQADIADILASVRGVVLTVQVTDKREGTIRVEFGKPATLLKSVAKVLVEEALRSLGISLVDFDQWTAEVSGTSLVLKGVFSEADMRCVASLFATSPVARDVHEPEASAETNAATSEARKVEASKKYFHSVKKLVEDLRKQLHNTRDNHIVWAERYARKIDDLPLKDVDPDLLTFGSNVSSSLRYQAQAGRSGALRAGVREAQPVYQSYSYGASAAGPYGSVGRWASGTVQVSPNRGQIRTEEHASAAAVKNSEMKAIEDGMAQIRRQMTERYNTEF